MCFSILAIVIAFLSDVSSAAAQETTLRRLEKEMLARIAERATKVGGFRFDTS
jgi:hypothetical protein